MRSYRWVLFQYEWCTYEERLEHRQVRGMTLLRHSKKRAIYKQARETLEETNPAKTLIWDF